VRQAKGVSYSGWESHWEKSSQLSHSESWEVWGDPGDNQGDGLGV